MKRHDKQEKFNAAQQGSSSRIGRIMLMSEPPDSGAPNRKHLACSAGRNSLPDWLSRVD
ncbi:MAG: hypothetical protein ACSLFH_17155 [Desulfuromonadales bacterium]